MSLFWIIDFMILNVLLILFTVRYNWFTLLISCYRVSAINFICSDEFSSMFVRSFRKDTPDDIELFKNCDDSIIDLRERFILDLLC